MTLKYLSNNKLQAITNTLSNEAFGNPYPYSIIFVDPKEVNTAKFYPYAEIPEGHEDECIIEVSKKMRHSSIENFILCLLYCLYQYNAWWRGVEPTDYSITRAELNNYIDILKNI
ncbi:hypothetical protein SAMN05421493_104103 [Pseudobutyrivibrio sp. 49]|uniref:hypothetical protein n=1 Tax=Pseudobutyrivibrio sp. 49 TaxID=1855344 RepID=UPI00088BFDDE|nr:hypothetical protein [Pseudobutyrivibrio sp. 49]SDH81488.1 hypothetical protein SAMN05421493_104103 [Pseudobutyrivibrio sp. 49]